jgi:hypothetical protein
MTLELVMFNIFLLIVCIYCFFFIPKQKTSLCSFGGVDYPAGSSIMNTRIFIGRACQDVECIEFFWRYCMSLTRFNKPPACWNIQECHPLYLCAIMENWFPRICLWLWSPTQWRILRMIMTPTSGTFINGLCRELEDHLMMKWSFAC